MAKEQEGRPGTYMSQEDSPFPAHLSWLLFSYDISAQVLFRCFSIQCWHRKEATLYKIASFFLFFFFISPHLYYFLLYVCCILAFAFASHLLFIYISYCTFLWVGSLVKGTLLGGNKKHINQHMICPNIVDEYVFLWLYSAVFLFMKWLVYWRRSHCRRSCTHSFTTTGTPHSLSFAL